MTLAATLLTLLLACSPPSDTATPCQPDCGCDAWAPAPPFAFAGDGTGGELDADGDGYGAADCDDGDAEVYPGADEVCDGVDNDCDGEVDEDAVDAGVWYLDADGDGYGGVERAWGCERPEGYVEDSTDCDDGDYTVNPGEREIYGDDIDDDCDGDLVGDCDADGVADFTYYGTRTFVAVGDVAMVVSIEGVGDICGAVCAGAAETAIRPFIATTAACRPEDEVTTPWTSRGEDLWLCAEALEAGASGSCAVLSGGGVQDFSSCHVDTY